MQTYITSQKLKFEYHLFQTLIYAMSVRELTKAPPYYAVYFECDKTWSAVRKGSIECDGIPQVGESYDIQWGNSKRNVSKGVVRSQGGYKEMWNFVNCNASESSVAQDDEQESNTEEPLPGGNSASTVQTTLTVQTTKRKARKPAEPKVTKRETETGCVQVLNDVNFDWLEEKKQLRSDSPLLALILEPTRELAIQVKNHLCQATKYTDIKIASVVGGMAPQKQKRMLKRHPEIVVATPGRLWELIEEGEPHLSTVTSVKSLVIDEADRMIEKGHFEELSKLLLHINSDALQKKKRQTFVFSATLTFVHSGPDRTIRKKVKMTETDKLASLVKTIGLKERPKIIDITTKVGTAETLTEARINCTAEEKDLYLYYFLRQYPGRTLVFANSKDCIRRLVSVFTLLKCNPFPLHADMHQRQRLKNLDRFSGNESGLLLASDVAARGLDIPNVHHVIHYQVPKTVENYVHRSGRTARACKEGLSVMLVGADDVRNYRKIISSLNRNEDLPVFPIEYQYLSVLNSRVNLATRIDAEEHRFLKLKRKNDWFQKAADELDIELDADVLTHDLGTTKRQTDLMKKLKYDKRELCQLLKQTVAPHSFSGKYPTKMGKLFTPKRSETTFDAVAHVKRDKTFQKQLVERIEKRNKKIDAKKAELMKIKKQKKKWKRKKKPKK